MEGVAKLFGVNDPTTLSALQIDLKELAKRFRAIIAETPFNLPGSPGDMTLTQRSRLLGTNILTPSERLLEALRVEGSSKLASWPEKFDSEPSAEEKAELRQSICRLRAFANDLKTDLQQRIDEGANHNTELRREIVYDLMGCLSCHVPHVTQVRGVYVKKNGDSGAFPTFIREAFFQITGRREKLDRHLQEWIKFKR